MGRLTIHDLGWTREEAAYVRGIWGAMAEDWDDPEMDVYDEIANNPCIYCGSLCWCNGDYASTYLDAPTHCPTCSKPVDGDTGFCTHCGER